MFCLKYLKIYLNINSKFIIFDIYSYADIKPICNSLIKWVRVGFLNNKAISKASFLIDSSVIIK